MNDKEAYLEKIKARLDLLEARFNILKIKAKEAKTDARIRYEKQIKDLLKKRVAAHAQINNLSQKGEDAWEALKSGIEDALNDLRNAIKDATTQLET